MKNLRLTSEDVQNLWFIVLDNWDATVSSKGSSGFMETVGDFLDVVGVLDASDFMERFTTTIFDTIYIPFELGDATHPGYSLWGQITVLAHEMEHVRQYKERPVRFVTEYIGSRSSRAAFEAQAYAADLELHFWRFGEPYDVKARADSLRHYGLGQKHIDFVAEYLRNVAENLTRGATVSDVSGFIMSHLEAFNLEKP